MDRTRYGVGTSVETTSAFAFLTPGRPPMPPRVRAGAPVAGPGHRAGRKVVSAMVRLTVALVLVAITAFAARADAGGVDFSLPDVTGQVHRLSDHRGKWVVVNFWATWCGPCMAEIPELVRFHERHKDHDAVVIGVNFEEIETPALAAFIARMRIGYPVVRAGGEPLLPFEPLKGLPSTFFVDPKGELAAGHTGPVTAEAIEDFLARETH